MYNLNNNELKKIKGGFGFWSGALLVSGFVFICGVLKGISNPVKCG